MAGDAEMQPAGSELSLSDLAGMLDGDEQADEQEDGAEEGAQDEHEGEEAEQDAEEGEEQEEGEEDEAKDDPTVTIKHDGKEVTIKQSEALELAQKGMDYTKKTMALAEDRKAVETERSTAEQIRAHHETALTATLDRLTAFQQFMESQVGQPPDISLAQQDAAEYLARKQHYEDRKGTLDRTLQAIDTVKQEAQRQRQARLVEQADATEKALRDTLPGWNETTLDELAGYMGKVGINPQTAADAFVHKGLWELAHKAKAYDAIVAKKAELKPTAQLAKVQKPAASNQPNRTQQAKTEAMKRFQANPRLETLADLL